MFHLRYIFIVVSVSRCISHFPDLSTYIRPAQPKAPGRHVAHSSVISPAEAGDTRKYLLTRSLATPRKNASLTYSTCPCTFVKHADCVRPSY